MARIERYTILHDENATVLHPIPPHFSLRGVGLSAP